MSVGGMVQDQVHDDPDAAPASLAHQPVEVFKGAEARIHVTVVGDVVSEVFHGGGINRRQPEGIDPQRIRRAVVQIVQSCDDPGKVADPVAVGVLKTPGIDLVHDGGLPPPQRIRCHADIMRVGRPELGACGPRRCLYPAGSWRRIVYK